MYQNATPSFNSLMSTVSEDFRKFIWSFFSYHYFERISIEKIKSHKWVTNGEVMSKGEATKEMMRRKFILDEKYKSSPMLA